MVGADRQGRGQPENGRQRRYKQYRVQPERQDHRYVPFPNRTVKLWSIDSADEPGDPIKYRYVVSYLGRQRAALSQDGKTLASASFEKGHGVVKLWSAETGQELRTLVSQEDTMFRALTFNPSSEVLACWSFDLNRLTPQGERAHVRTFSTQTGKELRRASGSASVLLSILVFSKDGNTLAGSAGDPFEGVDSDRQRSIKLWNAETLEELRTISGHQKAVFSLAFSPDGSTLASGSLDRTVKLWSVQSGTERLTFTGHAEGPSRAVVGGDTHDAVRILAFSPDGKTLVSGTVDFLKLWSADSGEEIQTLTPPKEQLTGTEPPWLTGAIFSPDGRTLASASWNGRLILWDPTTGRQRHSWVFPGKITLLGFSPDGRLLATENANGTCYFLRVRYQEQAINKFAFQMTLQSQTPPGTAKLIHAAFVMYTLSYFLPAVVIAGDLTFGFMAALLSFVGMFERGLERGQAPACLLGALANVLMVGGYVCYSLRWFSQMLSSPYLVASSLAGLAAVCALGAAVFLATGSETFAPLIGYFAWLASMIIMSFACWKLGEVSENTDRYTKTTFHCATRIPLLRQLGPLGCPAHVEPT